MKNSLLKRVSNDKETSGSSRGPAVVFYALSVIVAFIAGGYFERAKAPPSPTEKVVSMESTPEATPPVTAQSTPLQTPVSSTPSPTAPVAIISVPSATPALITVPSATPVRIEKAVAVARSSAPAAAPVAVATPAQVTRQPGQVAMVKDVEAPVKQGNKITGYIYLKAGQFIKPAGVDRDQIKVISGEGYAFVPVSATDMTH